MKAASDFERASSVEPRLSVRTSGSAEEEGTDALKYSEQNPSGE